MTKILGTLIAVLVLLAGCAPAPDIDGSAYRITAREAGQIPFRMLDGVNELRSASGLGAVSLNSSLNAAAATHSKDMARQNRPWHFGSDGSSPLDRTQRAGYSGRFLSELISETFETELQTLSAWMSDPSTRQIILDPTARDMGFAWHQEANGKIWWTLVMGGSGAPIQVTPNVAADQGT